MTQYPERCEPVLEQIRDDDHPSKHDLADALGYRPNTIRDYIETLQDNGIDIEFSHQRKGYYVDEGTDWESVPDDPPDDDPDDDPDEGTDWESVPEPDGSLPDLSDAQADAIRALPANIDEVATAINGDEHDAHAALDLLRNDGIKIRFDPESGVYYLADERSSQLRSQTHLSLSAKTKRAKAHLREEQAILDRLPPTDPLHIDGFDPDPDKETMVAALGDLHFGDEVRNDRGEITHDRDILHEGADQFVRKVIRTADHWPAEFDECVVPILGDIATGTKIYKKQKNDIKDLLAKQIRDGGETLTRIVATLREHFDAVRVRCVVGNHGFQDASAARGSNTDLVCYYWMREALRREGYDDVDIIIGEETHHLNFKIRDWSVHLRHGQDSQKQVDETARSEADWRGWRDKHQFDIGIRGHHHVPSMHWVLNRYPVITVPSPKPGGEFADRIGDPDASTPADRLTERKLGYCFSVADKRRTPTNERMIDGG